MDDKNTYISEKEYDKLVKRLEFFDTMRNNLLTFSFTAVLTVLGAALAMDMDSRSSWMCLVPFFLIIPFAARIAYYRLASAHINSFMRTFSQADMRFEIGAKDVPEGECKRYALIAWLVNHEMALLGVATSSTFWFKYFINKDMINPWDCIAVIIPIALMILVFLITNSTSDYKELITSFSNKWENLAHKNR